MVAAQVHLVKDINLQQTPESSTPGGLASVGNVTYFFATDAKTGNELWKTDGTAAGTMLVKDILPGPFSGVPANRFGAPVIGSHMVFVASDGEHGQELWTSDGTADGTVMLADIAPGAASSNPGFGAVIGSTGYFTATTPASGTEVWRTDGTPAGTRMVKDLNAGAASSSPRLLGAMASLLVFRAFDGLATGLFTTDGTAEGTKLVDHFGATAGAALGQEFLFSVATGTNSWNLMKTDGTALGTPVIRTAFSGTPASTFAVLNGVAYFVADDGISGSEIWRSDGTAGGTYLLADLAPGSAGLTISGMAGMGGRLLFMTSGADGQLWISDGTASGTRVVKNLPFATPGTVSGANYYFGWNDGTHGFELWKSDGSPAGTSLVADIAPGTGGSIATAFFVRRPEGIFFGANNATAGLEPWVSDGTATGTRMVKNIADETALGSSPSGLASIGRTLFFSAWDGVSSSLWTSDGTPAGTLPVSPSAAGAAQPTGVGIVSGSIYYFVAGQLPALELWRTDGTTAGTFRLFRQSESRFFAALTPYRGGLFFQGSDDAHGAEPWFTDGTTAGTRLIADLLPGPGGSFGYTDGAVVAGDLVYFPAAGTGPGGPQAWRTDGTTAGTRMLVTPDWRDSQSPRAFTQIGEWVFFTAYLHDSAFNLWRTNIATGENVLVRRFDGPRAPAAMWNAGGRLLFMLPGELWRSDGTESGTTKVRDGIPVPFCFDPQNFAVGGGILFWYAVNNGPELWRSDGTATGTFRLGAFHGPSASSLQTCLPHYIHYHSGRLYFIGNDDIHGAEPWVSDGTTGGTHLLYDLNPGPDSSDPGQFITIGGTLYFTATEPGSGGELWAACVDECPVRQRAVRR